MIQAVKVASMKGARVMKGKAIAFGIIYNVVFSAIMAAVMGLAASSLNNQPITWESFGWGFAQGFILNFIVGLLPWQKMIGAFAHMFGADSDLAKSFVGPLLPATVFLFALMFYFTAVNTGFVTFMTDAGPVTFAARFVGSFFGLWPIAYICCVFCTPISFVCAHKMTSFPPMPEKK
jgi:hypothetical protein